jgi:hypothetical protein
LTPRSSSGRFFFFLVGLGFELRQALYCLNHTSRPFCSHLHPIWRWGLMNYLPWLASSLDPPNLSLPSSQDDRCEPPHLASVHSYFPNVTHNHCHLLIPVSLLPQVGATGWSRLFFCFQTCLWIKKSDCATSSR